MEPELIERLKEKIDELDNFFRLKEGENFEIIFDKETSLEIKKIDNEIRGLKEFGTTGYPIPQVEERIKYLKNRIDELYKLGKPPEDKLYSSTGE